MILRRFLPWVYGEAPLDQTAATRFINSKLKDLESKFEDLSRSASHGPVPGAYLTLHFHLDNGGAFGGGEETIPLRTNFDLTPVYFTANTSFDSVTCQLRDGATDLLGAALDTAAVEPWVNQLSAFTVTKIAKQASLRVRVVTPTGNPEVIDATLICSHVQKVDSPQGVLP